MPHSKSINKTTSDLTRHLISVFGDSPKKQEALLKGANISAAQLSGRKALIEPQSQQVVMRNISKSFGAGWVFRYHREISLSIEDELHTALLHAPNLGDALDILTKFCHLREPNLYIEQFKLDGLRHVMFDFVSGNIRENRSVLNFVCMSIYQFIDQIWQPSRRGIEVRLPYVKPDYDQQIKYAFACPISYGSQRYAFVINEELCALENPATDRNVYNRSVINLYKQSGGLSEADDFVQTLKTHLESISNHRPNADEIAEALRMSKRTLNRRLLTAGTSFRVLLDKSLKSRAQKLLTNTRLSHREIADRLGYNDQTSFSRALKRWKHQDE
ncbi:MAG: helix-turn-helix domain-containing protein [Hyphomonadaceae bacterium]|nr:helix-turn-helix domain-containing protein [Hyphomonadaceae bacterium]